MKKRSLLLVVALLCVASLMAAMAYTSARVTNTMQISVSGTDESLLALKAGEHSDTANLVKEEATKLGKVLVVNFGKVQRNSEYIWRNLFKIKNNSDDPITVTFGTTAAIPEGVTILISKADSKDYVLLQDAVFTNWSAGNESNINVKVITSDGAKIGNFTPNLVVFGEENVKK